MEDNKQLIDRSAKVAIKSLRFLRNNSKKNAGTISRIEKALDIKLMEIYNEPKKMVHEEM